MGLDSSKPSPRTPSPPMLDRPWRKTKPWNSDLRLSLLNEVKDFKPQHVNRAKILMIGQIGAGKSSLVNTISSVVRGYVKHPAHAGTTGSKSVTQEYKEYTIICTPTSNPLSFMFCDTQGLEHDYGFSDDEFGLLVEGNVKDGHAFNPNAEMTKNTNGYRKSPTLADQVHCVCFVFDATTVAHIYPALRQRFRLFVEKLRRKDLSYVVLLTKIDNVDEIVQNDYSTVYRSKKIQTKIKTVSEFLHVPISLVIPIKNYSHEHDLDDNLDILALLAIRQILRASETFLEKCDHM